MDCEQNITMRTHRHHLTTSISDDLKETTSTFDTTMMSLTSLNESETIMELTDKINELTN